MVLQGCRASPSPQGDDLVKFLGYCPQENPLWPSLTVKEHLELYAAVKGLDKEDAALSILRYREKPPSYFVAGGREEFVISSRNMERRS